MEERGNEWPVILNSEADCIPVAADRFAGFCAAARHARDKSSAARLGREFLSRRSQRTNDYHCRRVIALYVPWKGSRSFHFPAEITLPREQIRGNVTEINSPCNSHPPVVSQQYCDSLKEFQPQKESARGKPGRFGSFDFKVSLMKRSLQVCPEI